MSKNETRPAPDWTGHDYGSYESGDEYGMRAGVPPTKQKEEESK